MKFTVIYIRYTPYSLGNDPPRVKTYEGNDEREVLNKIAKVHSYDFERQEMMSAKELYDNIMDVNGDGCDYIVNIFRGELVAYKPV